LPLRLNRKSMSTCKTLPTSTARLFQEYEFTTVTVNAQGEIVERASRRAQQFTQDLGGGVTLEMVAIPGGTFLMGSSQGRSYEDERPQHRVTVAAFLMGKYLVTQEQWQAVMGTDLPWRCNGAKRPVENVSWNSACEFCERLSRKSGRVYRLPSEAEWEYACRAGTATPFSFGETITTDLANYCGEHTYRAEPKGVYRHETTEVGSFPPNAFGLYDLHGNVWEWCADTWHDSYDGAPTDGSAWKSGRDSFRVVRGGSWHEPPDNCRSALRLRLDPSEGDDLIGFRLASFLSEM
jgi:formylglycine-generating enzyme required for sulfatase activity